MDLQERLEAALDAAVRAAALTKQLLTFGRRQITDRRPLDPCLVLRDMHNILASLITTQIDLSLEMDPESGQILADQGELEQILLNLVANARDAIWTRGLIEIKVSQVEKDKSHFVKIQVRDNGSGIPEELKGKILEPFFTTKEVGKGAGLGLATVHSIVTQSKGELIVDSELGKGTEITVLFPAVTEEHEERTRAHAVRGEYRDLGGSESILVIDDNSAVCDFTVRVLRRAGYRVLSTTDAGAAVALYKMDQQKLDLVVTDVVMPKINGIEVVEQLRSHGCMAPAIFTSGYSVDVISGCESLEILAKPYSVFQLLRRVRDGLERKGLIEEK